MLFPFASLFVYARHVCHPTVLIRADADFLAVVDTFRNVAVEIQLEHIALYCIGAIGRPVCRGHCAFRFIRKSQGHPNR